MENKNFADGPMRWGIIGCGNVTEVKSGPAYQKTNGFELAAVMRRDVERAADYAKRHGINKVHHSAEALIRDETIDAVYIATPPDTHTFYALQVAAAGKPCCIEKPMAPSYAESLAIYEAFETKGLPLFVAYYRRSLPRFLKVKEWLDAGEIGAVRHIVWFLGKPPSETDFNGSPNWRTDAKVAPGGYFDDLASHGLDLFTYLLGNINTVQGMALNQQGLYTAKDAITAIWVHENGVMGQGSWNFGCHAREDRVEIQGSRGTIRFSVFNEEDVVLDNGKGRSAHFIPHPLHVQQYHVENLRHYFTDGKEHPSTGKTALHTSWVMDRILGNI